MNSKYIFVIGFGGVATILSGCGNFDFRGAQRADGKYDLTKLISELDRRKPEPLMDMSWIPLVRLKATSFYHEPEFASNREEAPAWKPNAPFFESGGQPPGYSLTEIHSFGPLFSYLHSRDSFYDESGEGYEVREVKIFIWRLWLENRSVVKTPYGTREEKRNIFLFGLLDGFPHVNYSVAEKKPIGP